MQKSIESNFSKEALIAWLAKRFDRCWVLVQRPWKYLSSFVDTMNNVET
ncbi:MAG: hypothetical protein RIE73_16510 [Coleofasciculus sp. C1-SOL-03]